MSEAQDIRVWAKSHGIKLGEVGRIPADVREQYRAQANGDGDDDGDLPDMEVDEDDLMPGEPESPPEPPAAPAPQERVPERRPQPQPRPRKRRGILQRDKTTKAKRAKPVKARVSVENVVSSAWGLGALALSQANKWVPVARVLEMQAPWIGIVVEEKAKGTAADRWIQPFARMAETGGAVGSIVGFPLLVAIVTNQPQLFPVARPVMKLMLISTLEMSGPAMRKVQERAERLEATLQGVDVDGMLDSLWAGIPVSGEESPDEEAAVRRARGE